MRGGVGPYPDEGAGDETISCRISDTMSGIGLGSPATGTGERVLPGVREAPDRRPSDRGKQGPGRRGHRLGRRSPPFLDARAIARRSDPGDARPGSESWASARSGDDPVPRALVAGLCEDDQARWSEAQLAALFPGRRCNRILKGREPALVGSRAEIRKDTRSFSGESGEETDLHGPEPGPRGPEMPNPVQKSRLEKRCAEVGFSSLNDRNRSRSSLFSFQRRSIWSLPFVPCLCLFSAAIHRDDPSPRRRGHTPWRQAPDHRDGRRGAERRDHS